MDEQTPGNPPEPSPKDNGLAVVDNGGGVKHTVGPDVLTLAWK